MAPGVGIGVGRFHVEDEMPYTIINLVGLPSTRKHRWNSPVAHRSTQKIDRHRVLPLRPLRLPDAAYKRLESRILERVKAGKLMVKCPDGTVIRSAAVGTLIYKGPSAPAVVVEPISPPTAPVIVVQPVVEPPLVEDPFMEVLEEAAIEENGSEPSETKKKRRR